MSLDLIDIVASLIPASFGGVEFAIPNTRLTAGRRVQKTMFPGQDLPTFDDLGAMVGPMAITGLIVGDDYVARAAAMRAVFLTPGPTMLIHPWLGELLVILTQPGTITLDQASMRLARVEMTVELFPLPGPAGVDTLAAILAAAEDLQDAINSTMALIMTPVVLASAGIGLAETVFAQAAGIYGALVGGISALAAATGGAIAAMGTVGALPLDATWAPAATAILLAAPQAIVDVSATYLPAAIGPGDQAPVSEAVDASVTTALLLSATTQIAALQGLAPAGTVILAASACALSGAISASTDIVYASQEDALAMQAQLLAAIDLVAGLAVTLATSYPAGAGQIWRALAGMGGAVVADINAQLGRLPAVQAYTLGATMPVWLVAQALAGDKPAQMVSMYTDLVTRNGVTNPSMIGPGTIEALIAA